MNHSAIETITGEFVAALSDLIACYAGADPEIEPTTTKEISQTSAAIVGFGDGSFRGSAVLLAHPHVAVALAATAPLDAADWLGELSNQLVGRMKNKLWKYGLRPYLGTPVTVSGRELDLGAVGSEPAAWSVRWPGGDLKAVLALEVCEEIHLVANESAVLAEEGSLNLF